MAREVTADADLRFEGFASYPNSATFEPSSFLEYASNVRITDGVISPRKGSLLVLSLGSNSLADYAVPAHGASGDSIIFFGSNQRYTIDSEMVISDLGIQQYQRVRGQGYQNAICAESTDQSFTACGNITERLVTAENDQLRFTAYGGVKPVPADSLSLIQGTYDPIQAISTAHNSILAFGKRSIYSIKAGVGYLATPKKQDALHQVQKISSFDGVTGKDALATMGGITVFFDSNRRPGIKVLAGEKFLEGGEPMSTLIHDIIDRVDPAYYDKVCIVAFCGRFYVSLPFSEGGQLRWRVLVLNPQLKGMFESLDEYPFNPSVLLVARKDGRPRLHAFDVTSKELYRLEDGLVDDRVDASQAVTSEIRTRNYMFRTMADKKYDAFYVHMDNTDESNVQIKAITINPDSEQVMDKFSDAKGATVRRGLINKRAMGVKLKIIVTGGSARILACGLDASVAGRSLFSIY
jgi:hypothetical protein